MRVASLCRLLQSFRVPIDPRVLRLRYSPSNHQHANIIRPLLQLVERQNSTLATLPRIRQARSEMEKKLDELNKRLEIFSELNDAYQALIDNLKGVQHDQTQKIEHLQSTIERLLQEQQQRRVGGSEPPPCLPDDEDDQGPASVVRSFVASSSIRVLPLVNEEEEDVMAEAIKDGVVVSDGDQSPQLETEIIYDFVV